jgi:hypothetical protein
MSKVEEKLNAEQNMKRDEYQMIVGGEVVDAASGETFTT